MCAQPRRAEHCRCDPQARPSTSFVVNKIDMPLAKFSKSIVWGEVPEGSTLILEVPEFPSNTMYTVSQKNKTPNSCPYLHQILADFLNSFTVRLSRKFATKSYTNTPPHPKRVATLPCEISVFKKSPFLRSK